MADETLNLKLDEADKKRLQPQIKAKLTSLLETDPGDDTTLFDYVMLLISNNRPKTHVSSDLEAFFGQEQATSFTEWLWDTLQHFQRDKERERSPDRKDRDRRGRGSRRDRSRSRSRERERDRRGSGRDRDRERDRSERTRSSGLAAKMFKDAVSQSSLGNNGSSRRPSASSSGGSGTKRARQEETASAVEDASKKRRVVIEEAAVSTPTKPTTRFTVTLKGKSSANGDSDTRAGARDSAPVPVSSAAVVDTAGMDEGEPEADAYEAEDLAVAAVAGATPQALRHAKQQARRHASRMTGAAPEPEADGEGEGTEADGAQDEATVITQTSQPEPQPAAVQASPAQAQSQTQPQVQAQSQVPYQQPAAVQPQPQMMDAGGVPVPVAYMGSMGSAPVHVVMTPRLPGLPAAGPARVRCSFWPSCTKGPACPFVHPSQPCQFFPNCSFGDKCLYLHPVMPRKLGKPRPGSGPAGRGRPLPLSGAGMPGRRPQPQRKSIDGQPSLDGQPLAPSAATSVAEPSPAAESRTEAGAAGAPAAVKADAGLGSAPVAATASESLGTRCRYGLKCTRQDCKFSHPPKREVRLQVRQEARAQRAGDQSGVACKFDPKCNNITCHFAHPKRDAAEQSFLGLAQENKEVSKLSASLPKTP